MFSGLKFDCIIWKTENYMKIDGKAKHDLIVIDRD